MRFIAGLTIGIIAGLYIASHVIEQQLPARNTDDAVIVETYIEEVIVHTDLDDLRQAFAETAEQLRQECLYIIERQTGDPMAGIIRHVDRHYQGDACKAADEALAGGW